MINEITLIWLIIGRISYNLIGFDLRWLHQFLKLHTYGCHFRTICSALSPLHYALTQVLLITLHPDGYLASEPNSIEVIIIRSTRTVFNFYLAILLLKRM